MKIKIVKALPKYLKPKPDSAKLGFGKHFTDHMFTMKYKEGDGWYDPVIEPYQLLQLDPTAMCLHYGQEIFEGLKAYRGKNDEIYLFRPMENIRRMNVSADRLCMAPIDETVFLTPSNNLFCLSANGFPASRVHPFISGRR